jgi:hypothetical protein
MTARRLGVVLVIVSSIWLAAGASASDNVSNTASDAAGEQTIERLNRLESRMTELESQVATLKRENIEAQQSLKNQQAANAALKSQLARQPDYSKVQPVQDDPAAAGDDRKHRDLISNWGVRAGYQGFPFGQKEGGFFYGLFVDSPLIHHEDGMPGGDLDLEVGGGVAFSGSDQVTVRSAVVGARTNVEFRQRMVSIWPGLKYSFDFWQNYGLSPYLTAGPGVWVDIIETPPLVGGLQFPTKQLNARKLPVIAGASLFEGAQGGAGFDFKLPTENPILERMKVGFDYRYSAWTTGQRFNTYSLLLTYAY